MAGGYVDDNDAGSDGTLFYTGSGGQKDRRQVKDQIINSANASLIRSKDTRLPIRLLQKDTRRQGKPEYFYDGLFRCESYSYEESTDGPMEYKFKIVPIPGLSSHSVTVESCRSSRSAQGDGVRNRLLNHENHRRRERDREENRRRCDATRRAED